MARHTKYWLVFLLFSLVTGLQMVRAFPVQPSIAALRDDGIHRTRDFPNAEAECYQLVFSASVYGAAAKFASRSEMQAVCNLVIPAVLQQVEHIKQSSKLEKDYLLHIYPSHNFW